MFRQLDTALGRLAVKLPLGDLGPQAARVVGLLGGGGNGGGGSGGDDDEDDELM